MPVWHAATEPLRDDDRWRTVGLAQEQHGDRARLFAAWKSLRGPIAVDALNDLDVALVPITVAIDEWGVVRALPDRRTDPARFVEGFLAAEYAPPDSRVRADAGPRPAFRRKLRRGLASGGRALERALRLAEGVRAESPEDPAVAFRVGVLRRARYDSSLRRPGDFQAAVDAWSAALAGAPDRYVWRRRIQQYGPRLSKPYPFYDWVEDARRELAARGESPAPLRVEPSITERAAPAGDWPAASPAEPPDPEGRVRRDGSLVEAEVVVVPAVNEGARVDRVHVVLRPRADTHWNHEVDGLRVWWEPAAGLEIAGDGFDPPRADVPTSEEPRVLEFEMRRTAGAPSRLEGYALYYVCEGARGACLHRRRDLVVEWDD